MKNRFSSSLVIESKKRVSRLKTWRIGVCTDGCSEALKRFITKWQGFKKFKGLHSIKVYSKYPDNIVKFIIKYKE